MDPETDIEITEVAYGRTINVGDYENVRLDFRARVNPGQTYKQVLKALERICDAEEVRTRREFGQQ